MATFRVLYVFVVMEVGTLQQFREALPGDHGYQYVIHDRDRIYSHELDQGVES